MKKDTQKAGGGRLKKSYKAQAKKMSTYDLRTMLKVIYQNRELGFDVRDLNKLPREKDELVPKNTDKQSYIYDKSTSDTLKLLGVVENGEMSKTKALFLIEVVKSTLNLRATGKEFPEDQTISQIECFTNDRSKNAYKIVINKDYEHPLDVSKSTGIWSMFLEMLENSSLPYSSKNKQLFDYLNFNNGNLITKNTNYPLQVIIEQRDTEYVPLFKYAISKEKVLVRRQNKLKDSA